MMHLFNSLGELTKHLEKLETRITSLEEENERLRSAPQARDNLHGNAIARVVSRSLPKTSLLSPSFFKRAFTVWGHFFVANLVISLFFFVLYACLMMAIFGSAFGDLIQNQP